jgi:hypothetical protein
MTWFRVYVGPSVTDYWGWIFLLQFICRPDLMHDDEQGRYTLVGAEVYIRFCLPWPLGRWRPKVLDVRFRSDAGEIATRLASGA